MPLCTFYRKTFFRYLPLNIFMLCRALADCGQYICITKFGFDSHQYYYFYYYTGSLLAILLFAVIIQFYQCVFKELEVSRYVRRTASLLLIFTAIFSYLVVYKNRDLSRQFVVEFSQNIYFVEVVLTYLLWGAILKLRETRTRLVQLILALGIYFSAAAGTYALRNLFPSLQEPILRWFPPLIATWLPVAWIYTFIKVPEEARLEPVRLVAGSLTVKSLAAKAQ